MPGSSVGIATDYGLNGPGSNTGGYEIFRRPDRPWGPPSLFYNGYRVFPGDKVRPGRAADHSPLLVPQSWKSRAISLPTTYTLGHTGPVTGSLYLLLYHSLNVCHKNSLTKLDPKEQERIFIQCLMQNLFKYNKHSYN